MISKNHHEDLMGSLLSAEAINHYYHNPIDFIQDNVIDPASRYKKGIFISSQQKVLMNAVAKNQRVGVESCHAAGKSSVLSWLAFWFVMTRHNPVADITKVQLCANSYGQLNRILWPELSRWVNMSRLQPLVVMEREKLYVPVWNEQGKMNPDQTTIKKVSPSNPDDIQGAHAPNLLWLFDEAFGIQDNLVWETVEGSLTSGFDNKLVFAGQHTTLSGYCHDAFHDDKKHWHTITLSAFDSPFCDTGYIERVASKWGTDSDVYRVRVLGTEPNSQSDAFLSFVEVESAFEREVEGSGDVSLGVDFARFGDDKTVITPRHGFKVYPQIKLSKADSIVVYREIIKCVKDMRAKTEYAGTIRIICDATGGHGSGSIDTLNRNREDNIEVIPVTYTAGNGDDVYANITSVMWGKLKSIIGKIELPSDGKDNDLRDELISRKLKYINNRIAVESKADIKRDKKASPDSSDSLCLAFYGAEKIKRVMPSYVTTNPVCHNTLKIKWDSLDPCTYETYVFITSFQNTINISYILYNAITEKIRVYDEDVIVSPTPDLVNASITGKIRSSLTKSHTVSLHSIWTDNLAFKGGRDIAYYLHRHAKVNIKEAGLYDRAGAIVATNRFLESGLLLVSEDCYKTDEQLSSWIYAGNGSPERGSPLANNILMATSVLKKRALEIAKERPKQGYVSKTTKEEFDRLVRGGNTKVKKDLGMWKYLAV